MYSNTTLPEAISHRGQRARFPENSIPAFLAALDAGAEGIELDVHATVDGAVFVHHDFDVTLEDGSKCPIRMAESAVISKLRLAEEAAIPTLDATLEAVGSRARVYIEVKPRGIESDVARCLKRHIDNAYNYSIHSFDHRIVKRMLEILPSIRTGILQVAYPIDSTDAMRRAGATDLWQHAEFIDATLVADVHSRTGRIIAWTANEPAQWKQLATLGVDGICTDHVDAYLAWRSTAVV